MEKPLIRKMRTNFRYFGGISILYGFIYAFCLYRNTHGITFILYTGATIAASLFMMKKINFTLQKKSKRYFIGMILLSISTCLTTDIFFIIFNWIGIILLFCVAMIHQFYNDGSWNFPAYLERIFILLGTSIGNFYYLFKHGTEFLSNSKHGKKKTTIAVAIGILISLALLSIIIPLLVSSDMVFANFFENILVFFNIDRIIGIGFIFIFGSVACYAFFSALATYNFPIENQKVKKYYNPIVAITFTSVLAIIYLVYCSIQILYLFIGITKGLPVGVTYSNYARVGFWQLIFVGIINFIIVLICRYIFYTHKVLKFILAAICTCTYIMLISAAYRVLAYVGEYHLTFLRVLALWFLIVLALIMTGIIMSIFKKTFHLFRYIVAVISISYILFALCRPNYWIAQYNVIHTKNMKISELTYLLNNYSEDAASVIAGIDPTKIDLELSYYEERDVKGLLYDYFSDISRDNKGIYFRKANYSRIRAKYVADQYLKEHKDYKKYSKLYRYN